MVLRSKRGIDKEGIRDYCHDIEIKIGKRYQYRKVSDCLKALERDFLVVLRSERGIDKEGIRDYCNDIEIKIGKKYQ